MTTAVAVLNATYEPVGSTRVARAISLVMKGEAVVEESDPHRSIRSKSGEYVWPLVIRLLRFVKVPVRYGPKVLTKSGVLERDGYACAYCKKKGRNIVTTVDHILPRAQGGKDSWMNLVACCSRCNGEKADRTPEQAGMVLRYQPTVPMRMFISSKG